MFAVQERIALNVARVLDVALSPEATAALASLPTKNLDAYQAFLRGNLHASQYLVRAEQEQAMADLTEAVRLDPKFAVAYARLAQVQDGFPQNLRRDSRIGSPRSRYRSTARWPSLPTCRSRVSCSGMWYGHGAGDPGESAEGVRIGEGASAQQR